MFCLTVALFALAGRLAESHAFREAMELLPMNCPVTDLKHRIEKGTVTNYLIISDWFTVSKPAPHWEGTAVIDGEFKELKLSDYKGKYLVFFFYPLDL